MRSSCFCILAIALCPLVFGCRVGRREYRPRTTADRAAERRSQTMTVEGVRASGSARDQLNQLDRLLRGRGFVPSGPAIRGSLQQNGLAAYALDAVANACYTVAVLGEGDATDLNIITVDPLGRAGPHDVRPDRHPWVSFCARQAGRYVVRVQMAAGSGAFYYAAYVGRAGHQMDLSAFFGDAGDDGPRVARLDTVTRNRIAALDAELSRRGYRRVGEPSGMQLSVAAPREFQLQLERGQCYFFASLGGEGARATAVSLHDASGERLAQGTPRGPDSQLSHCAASGGQYALQVRMAAGTGALFAVGYVQQRRGSPPSTEHVMARHSTAGAGAEEAFALVDAEIRARGYVAYGEPTPGALPAGGHRDYEVDLEGEKCYAIIAAGSAAVSRLDLTLVDRRGREVDRDGSAGARPAVRVCPPRDGHYTVRVALGGQRPRATGEGGGDPANGYVYAVYRWPRGIRGPFGLEGLMYVRLAELTSLLSAEGYEPDPGFTPEGGRIQPGAARSHTLPFTGGKCYAVVTVGGDGVSRIALQLNDNAGRVVAGVTRLHSHASVRHCAPADGPYRVDVTASAGSGRYHIQVFSRPDSARERPST